MVKVIEQKEAAFKPITITLETKEEAETLWHFLNNNGDIQDYLKRTRHHQPHTIRDIKEMLWQALDDVFTPETEDC
jgi:hypothetical protein